MQAKKVEKNYVQSLIMQPDRDCKDYGNTAVGTFLR